MTILVDSREQKVLDFSHPHITDIVTTTLPVGDYSVKYKDGYIPPIVFERKSLGDLFGTMTHGYERFKRLIEKAKQLDIKLMLVIEGTYTKVSKGYGRSDYKGSSMVKKLMTMWIKYNLVPIFCQTRTEMAQVITEYFVAIGRLKGKKK